MNNGKQDGGHLFKPSYYNFFTKDESGNGLLYNTRSGSVAYFDNTEAGLIESILNGSKIFRKSDIYESDDLIEEGFLVDDNIDELDDVMSKYKLFATDRTLHLTIFPTNNCNFNCVYCFVNHEEFKSMQNEEYDKIFKLIKNKAECIKGIKALEILWFGGEPLLKIHNIISFMSKIKGFCIEKKVELTSTIVTNGYLLNKHNFINLIESGVNDFQVTFDGDKETHDYFRSTRTNKPTFDTIYNNLLTIKNEITDKKFKIIIRSNFTSNNLSSQYSLIDKLQNDFANDKRFYFSFKPIININNDSLECACSDLETKVFQLEITRYCNNKLSNHHRTVEILPKPITGWCNSAMKNTYIIIPSSLIFTCDSLVSDPDKAVGLLRQDGVIEFFSLYEKWLKTAINTLKSKCKKCRLLPICYGGCVRKQIINKHTCPYSEDDILNKMQFILTEIAT